MIRILKATILCCGLCLAVLSVGFAQNTNLSNADVKTFSDAQIKKLVTEMNERGLTIEQAAALARTRGASETQIRQIRQRIESLRWSTSKDSEVIDDDDKLESSDEEQLSKKAEFEEEEEEETSIFGFNFFNTKNLSFAPSVNIPVSEEYILGKGDEVIINVYGASQQTYMLTVEKNGALQIPQLGPVYIGGLTLKKAKQKIKNRLLSIYSSMQGNKPNTFAEISLGALKGINVNVIGEVYVPGTYTLPATATAFNALYLAGGPGQTGSFRKIQVIRNGEIYKSIDVYKYLIDGDTKDNIQLRDQDVILIKPYINRVNIEGEFKRTGIFEAKEGEKVSDLIRFAGGFTANAYTNRLGLYRNNTRTLSFKDVPIENFDKIEVKNGDSLVAGTIVFRFENRVSIEGAVYRPGLYELTKGMKLSELLARAEGIKEEAFLERGLIVRTQKDMSLETLPFSVKDILSGKSDVELLKEDVVRISSIFDLREARTIKVFGEVQYPDTYTFTDNMLLKDLIFQAGGFKENADISSIEVTRRLNYDEIANLTSKLMHTFQFSVDRNLKIVESGENFKLMPFDQVYIRQAPGYRPQGTILIQGEVKYAGSYGITKKQERISDIIKRAGGFTSEAYIKGASLRRKVKMSEAEYQAKLKLAEQDTTLNKEEIKKEEYQTVGIRLDKILNNIGGEQDILVENEDQILIPTLMQTVKISGSVMNPVALTYNKNIGLHEYINKSGGFAKRAKKNKVYVLYANGTTAATKRRLFKKYPKIEPGCEIIVPNKPEMDNTVQTTKWVALTSGFASFTASMIAIISLTVK